MGRSGEQKLPQRRQTQSQREIQMKWTIKVISHYDIGPYQIKNKNKCWSCSEKGILIHCQWQCHLVIHLWKLIYFSNMVHFKI